MSRHLTGSEFVDAVERRLSGGRLEHAENCPECRTEVEQLRAALDAAATDGAAEPSPLFWEHFGPRVSQAIRGEAIEPAPRWGGWLRPAAITAAAAVAVIAVSVVTLTPRRGPSTAEPSRPSARVAPIPASPEAAALEPDDDLDADAAWAVVRTAAEGIDWDDARAAGLQAQPGTADRMVLEMTEAERMELLRILEQEMKRSGA